MKESHTPGPWFYHKNQIVTATETGDPGFAIADIVPLPNAEANAQLIAASPELLAGYKACAAKIENWRNLLKNKTDTASDTIRYNMELELDTIRADIAKAEGRTH